MAPERALDSTEEAFWRALLRVVIALPRALDADLTRSTGLTMTEMVVLIALLDAPGRELRMSQIAEVTALSPSRVTRIVADLQGRRLVAKRVSADDGRGNVTALTPEGRKQIRRTYPGRLRSVRGRVIDRVDPSHLPLLLDAMRGILDGVALGSTIDAEPSES